MAKQMANDSTDVFLQTIGNGPLKQQQQKTDDIMMLALNNIDSYQREKEIRK